MALAQAYKAIRDARALRKVVGASMPDASGGKDAGKKIDRNALEISDTLDSRGKLYRKVATVRARRASRATPVTTVLDDGTRETSNVAEPGDYIVTGIGGERYVVKPGVFEARYALKPRRKNVYIARGETIAVENPFGRPLSIMAAWGEWQRGAANCMIADAIDPSTRRRAGKPYIIARKEFDRTYEPVPLRAKKAHPAAKRKAERKQP